MKPILTSFALALALAGPVQAQGLAPTDLEAVELLRDEFNTAFTNNDIDAVVGAVPPKVIQFIAETNGIDPDQFRTMMVQQTEAMMGSVEVLGFSMDTGNMITGETPAGRTYALVPTVTEMDVDGAGKIRSTSDTVFLQDEGEWYMVRVDNAQQEQILKAVYPDFADVEFTPGTVEQID